MGKLVKRSALGLAAFFFLIACSGNRGTPVPTKAETALALSTRESAAPATSQRLQPANLIYRGAFAFPAGDEWSYSGHALAFFPTGDASGPPDGFPGSLYAVGHAWDQLVGEIAIPQPLISDDYAALPRAAILRPLTDITGGWLDNCTYTPDCIYREVAGLAYLPQVDKIGWNLRDWYNVSGADQDSLGWSEPDMSGAVGVWHIGSRDDAAFHNARTSNYLLQAPVDFADEYLGGKTVIAGNHRPAGAFGGSQGPTLFATAPWDDGNPPAAGQELAAQALLYYTENIACTNNDFAQCAFPGYRASDDWGGGAWVESGGMTAVLIFGRKGLGDNCYGIPGEDCPSSLCTTSKGWNSDPYEPQILFYDPAELAAVATGDRDPWDVAPYAVFRPVPEVFDADCAIFGSVAYDEENQLIYVTESGAGEFGATAVHVWQVDSSTAFEPSLFMPISVRIP